MNYQIISDGNDEVMMITDKQELEFLELIRELNYEQVDAVANMMDSMIKLREALK